MPPDHEPPDDVDEPESIEICGIRFAADEVHAVELKRDGRLIRIEAPEEPPRRFGFRA